MSNTRPHVPTLSSALALSAVPLIVTITVGVKIAYLVPLLKRWSEEPSLHYSKHQVEGRKTISRVAPHHITVSDPEMIRQILEMNVKGVDDAVPDSFLACSNLWLQGYEIPAGTLISLHDISK